MDKKDENKLTMLPYVIIIVFNIVIAIMGTILKTPVVVHTGYDDYLMDDGFSGETGTLVINYLVVLASIAITILIFLFNKKTKSSKTWSAVTMFLLIFIFPVEIAWVSGGFAGIRSERPIPILELIIRPANMNYNFERSSNSTRLKQYASDDHLEDYPYVRWFRYDLSPKNLFED